MYIIYPTINFGYDNMKYDEIEVNGTKIDLNKDFCYNTKNATPLSKEEIKLLLKDLKIF